MYKENSISLQVKDKTVISIKNLLIEIKKQQSYEFNKKINVLESELDRLKKIKRYWLVWEEKKEEFDEKSIWKLPILEERSYKNINQDETKNNILIEWDNYHTLSVLNYTHKWKIDVIYIDPPYNTWNWDFLYNDKLIDKEDNFKHSKWLSFIAKRLKLAQKLLSENWVIFISIDDNELAQLKILCDEIFWENNFIENYCWQKTQTPPSLSNKSRNNIDYILCYEKNKNSEKYFWRKSLNSDAPLLNKWNWFNILIFPIWSIKFNIKDKFYNKWKYWDIEIIKGFSVKNWINSTEVIMKWEFKWQQSNLENELKNSTYFLIKSLKMSIRYKKSNNRIPNMLPNKMIDSSFGVKTNEDASKQIKDLGFNFSFPKPTSLISFLIKMSKYNKKNITILDFFAWSWTTWHAVMELNKEDWWNRNFILATNNENRICEEVTYERLKKVMTWYKNSKWEEVKWLWWNLTYLKTKFIDKTKVNDDLRIKMVQQCSELLCLKENIWNEIEQKNDKIKLFKRNDKYLAILFDMFYFEEFKNILSELDKPVSIYAFSHYKLGKNDFENLDIKFELEEIPDPILEVYETIFWF